MRKAPEGAGQAEAVEDRLVVVLGVRAPVRGEAVAPPGVGELAQRGHGDGGAWLAADEPALDVLSRPEEVHRASSEDDVVPPAGRREAHPAPKSAAVRRSRDTTPGSARPRAGRRRCRTRPRRSSRTTTGRR